MASFSGAAFFYVFSEKSNQNITMAFMKFDEFKIYMKRKDQEKQDIFEKSKETFLTGIKTIIINTSTPIFLPGESRGQRNLEGYSP